MVILKNGIIPFRGFSAMNFFGILFVRNGVKLTPQLLNHERIHTAQIVDLCFLLFYPLYLLEWFVKLFIYGSKSYRNISFEREAYAHDSEPNYLAYRKPYAFLKYILKKD